MISGGSIGSFWWYIVLLPIFICFWVDSVGLGFRASSLAHEGSFGSSQSGVAALAAHTSTGYARRKSRFSLLWSLQLALFSPRKNQVFELFLHCNLIYGVFSSSLKCNSFSIVILDMDPVFISSCAVHYYNWWLIMYLRGCADFWSHLVGILNFGRCLGI